MSAIYTYEKRINPDTFMWEVQKSTITICIMDVGVKGAISTLTFKTALSIEEKATLDQLVINHDPDILLPEENIADVMVLEVPKYAVHEIDKTYIERSLIITTTTEELDNGQPYKVTYTNPYPIILLGGDMYPDDECKGDEAKMIVHMPTPHPNDIVAQTVADTVIGVNKFMASPGSSKVTLWKSYEVMLISPDMQTILPLGEIIDINGDEITVSGNMSQIMPAGSYVSAIAVPIPFLKITSKRIKVRIGDGTTRGTYIPKGCTIEILYWNKSHQAKDVGFMIEYYV